MKAQNLFVVILLLCFSCGTQITDSEKEKIQKEVKEQFKATIQALESVDPEATKQTLLDSPDFRYAAGGKTIGFQEINERVKANFKTRINQKAEIIKENIWVLDNSTALYVAEVKWTVNNKDGRIIVSDPWVMENLLKKVDGKWKALYVSESGLQKLVPNPEKQKELNQIELHKQFIGTWNIEIGKDTLCIWEVKPYGTGFDCYFKYVANGKMFMEGKQLWGYDMTTDKFLMSEMIKGMDNQFYSWDFLSKNKCRITKFDDMLYPDRAKLRWEVEFISPNSFEQHFIFNDKITKIIKCQRAN